MAVGLVADGEHLGTELLERGRRDRRVRAVRAVHRELEASEVAAELLDDVADVARADHLEVVDPALLLVTRRLVEQCLDLLLRRVRELAAVPVEELDAVVLGRVVRSRDDGGEVEREQCDGRRGQDARQHGVAARRGYARGEGVLELPARRARITPYEHRPTAGPEGRGTAEPLTTTLWREILPDDSPYAVGAEVASRQGRDV